MISTWHEAPFLRPFIILILGTIFFDNIFIENVYLWIISMVALSIFYWLDAKPKNHLYPGIALIITIFIIAGIRVNIRKTPGPSHFSNFIDSTEYFSSVKIIEEPKKGKRYRSIAKITQIGNDLSQLKNVDGNILIYFPEDMTEIPNINQEYVIYGKIQKVVNNTNPYAFDWKAYLFNRGVSHQIFLKPNTFHCIGENTSHSIKGFARSIRQNFQNTIEKYVPDQDAKGIALAMILGYKNKLNEELYDSYTDTGAVHVLAVSGLHVGIMASILAFLFSFLKNDLMIQKLLKTSILIIGIWSYALITGGAPAIMRASIMFTIMVFDFYWSDSKNMINSLCAAGFIMILIDPYYIYQAGFQFSFLALLGILIFFRPINNLLPRIANPILRYSWGLVAVSIAAQITVFPITIYYFHKFPSYFWLSGVIAIPLAFIILSIGVGLIISNYFFPSLSQLLGELLSAFIKFLNSCIIKIQELPFSSNDDLWLSNLELSMIYLLISILLIAAATGRMVSLVKISLIGACLFTFHNIRSSESVTQLKMMVYDIYGGTVIDFVDGNKIRCLSKIPRIDDSERFMCHNYRLSIGSDNVQKFDIHEKWQSERILHNNGFILTQNKTIYIASDYNTTRINKDIDLIIITNLYTGNPYDIIDEFRPKAVLLDKSMSFDRFYKWKRILKNKKIHTINLFNTGAQSFNL
jgi:competence protein ComEC